MKVLSIIALALMITSPSFASSPNKDDGHGHKAEAAHATTEMPADAKPMTKKAKPKKTTAKAADASAADAAAHGTDAAAPAAPAAPAKTGH